MESVSIVSRVPTALVIKMRDAGAAIGGIFRNFAVSEESPSGRTAIPAAYYNMRFK